MSVVVVPGYSLLCYNRTFPRFSLEVVVVPGYSLLCYNQRVL